MHPQDPVAWATHNSAGLWEKASRAQDMACGGWGGRCPPTCGAEGWTKAPLSATAPTAVHGDGRDAGSKLAPDGSGGCRTITSQTLKGRSSSSHLEKTSHLQPWHLNNSSLSRSAPNSFSHRHKDWGR